MLKGGVTIWSEKVAKAVSAITSTACTVKLATPEVVGVPETTPTPLSKRPAGRLPEEREKT